MQTALLLTVMPMDSPQLIPSCHSEAHSEAALHGCLPLPCVISVHDSCLCMADASVQLVSVHRICLSVLVCTPYLCTYIYLVMSMHIKCVLL